MRSIGETVVNSNDYTEISTFRRALPQFIAVGVKNLVLFGYGMTLGFPTIVIPALKGGEGRVQDKGFSLSDDEISWFSSLNLLCVPLGCFLSGVLTEATGKRRAMQLVNIPMLVSWMLFYFSTNIYHLYSSLCLAGLSGGLMEAPVLTYVAEVTQPQFRGMLAASGTTCVITGILVQFVLGAFMSWRMVSLTCIGLPLFTILALCFIPESPYWLLTKGRVTEARDSLAWLRGWLDHTHTEHEFNEIKDILLKKKEEADELAAKPFHYRFQPYTRQSFIAPFLLISATFFIGHFSGKTPLQTYAVQIFHTLKAPIDKYYATIFLGVAELVGALISVFLVHSVGKRPLVFTSLIGCGLCFFGTATYAYYLDSVPGSSVRNVVSIHSDFNGTSFSNKDNPFMNFTFEDAEATTDPVRIFDWDDSNAMETTEAVDTVRVKRLHVSEDERKAELAQSNDFADKVILPLPNAEENQFLWMPLTLLLSGALFAHMGIRLIPWMLIGEVFPVSVRSAGSGMSAGVGYIFGFLSNKLYLGMLTTLTLSGTFWLYSAVALIGCSVLYFVLPETEGKSLIDIEAYFVGTAASADEEIDPNGMNLSDMGKPNQIAIIPPSNGSSRITLRLGSVDASAVIANEQRRPSAISNILPEIVVTTPRAGSKRFMKTTNEVRRSSMGAADDSTNL